MVRSTLIQIFNHALGMCLIENNQARGTKLPKQCKRPETVEGKAISIALQEEILSATADALIMLMFMGMRIGELLGLQWRHVDFERKSISAVHPTLLIGVGSYNNVGIIVWPQ